MARRSLCVLTTEWPIATTESPELNKALSVILGLPENEIADALAKCRDKGSLTLLGDDVKISAQQYSKSDPTIPVADWEDIAGQHGVPLSFMALNEALEHHSLTPCYPPPSFHYALFQSAWHAFDVFDDLGQKKGEGARVRTLEPYILAVASIFRGRIITLPDQPMKTKVLLAGGELKHEIYASGGSFFIVMETERLMLQKSAYVAQLFLELLGIAKTNSWNNLGRRRRVHGLLTDLYSYHFYSYDPVKECFAFDCTIKVPGNRGERLGRMLPVTNKIFDIALSGYVEMLNAYVKLEDGLAHEANLKEALQLSTAAHQLLSKPLTSKEDLEDQATTALALLQQSISLVPRLVTLENNVCEPTSQAELARAAEVHVNECLDRMIGGMLY